MLRQHHHGATSYGINDDSGHYYDQDVYWDEENVARDGQPRYDTLHEAYGVYGNPSADREFDETYQNSKGKAGKAKGKGYKGKGYKGKGSWFDRGRKGTREPTKARARKAKATGTTAVEATIVEEVLIVAATIAEEVLIMVVCGNGNGEKRDHDQSGSPYVPKKRMHCKVCAWSERDPHIVSNHDRETCNHQKEATWKDTVATNASRGSDKSTALITRRRRTAVDRLSPVHRRLA
jgi:hypothetical protein